jgi:hypothetical protein
MDDAWRAGQRWTRSGVRCKRESGSNMDDLAGANSSDCGQRGQNQRAEIFKREAARHQHNQPSCCTVRT